MRTLYILLILVSYINLNGQEQKSIDLKKSTLKWTARSTVTGSYSGNLAFNSGSITIMDSQIIDAEVEVNMLSLTAENKDLEKHLKAEDFFNVEKYLTATFSLIDKALINNSAIDAKGKMTIIGQTQEIIVKLQVDRSEGLITIKGKVIIDRTKFGIYHNSPSFLTRLKEKAIADEFEIKLGLVFQ